MLCSFDAVVKVRVNLSPDYRGLAYTTRSIILLSKNGIRNTETMGVYTARTFPSCGILCFVIDLRRLFVLPSCGNDLDTPEKTVRPTHTI